MMPLLNPIGFAKQSLAVPRGPSHGAGGLSIRVPRYANKDDLLTGLGSKSLQVPAGIHRRASPPSTSFDPQFNGARSIEVLAHFRYYGFPIESAMPRVTVSVRVQLVRVLDLTGGELAQPSASPSVGF